VKFQGLELHLELHWNFTGTSLNLGLVKFQLELHWNFTGTSPKVKFQLELHWNFTGTSKKQQTLEPKP